jgi:hypothetical protein
MPNDHQNNNPYIDSLNETIKRLASEIGSGITPKVCTADTSLNNLPDELSSYQTTGKRGRPFAPSMLLYIYTLDSLREGQSAVFPAKSLADIKSAINHIKKRNPNTRYTALTNAAANEVVVTNEGRKQQRRVFSKPTYENPVAYDPTKEPIKPRNLGEDW